jgi:hypothetical protein
MRAYTKGKHEIGKRFAIVIGVAAVGVMALDAQTVAQTPAPTPPAPAVVKYDTTLTITHEPACKRHCRGGKPEADPGRLKEGVAHWHGRVESDRTECIVGRRVILFRQQSGADRKLGRVAKSVDGRWGAGTAPIRGRVYARVSPKVGDGFVCLGARSLTITNGKLRDKEQPFTPLPTT